MQILYLDLITISWMSEQEMHCDNNKPSQEKLMY